MLLNSLSPGRTLELGIEAKTSPRSSIDKVFEVIAEYGLTCAEWTWAGPFGGSRLPAAAPLETTRAVARTAARHGVRICAISAQLNLIQPLACDYGLHHLPAFAESAAALETGLLITCNATGSPAQMSAYHHGDLSGIAWSEMIAGLRQASRIARRYGVRLAIALENASLLCDAERAEAALDELEADSDQLSIVLDAADLYRPPMSPDSLSKLIDDALERLGEFVSLAHANDIADPALPVVDSSPVPAGTGILPYPHYLTALVETPAIAAAAKHGQRLPLVLRGLSDDQVGVSVAFMRRLIEDLDGAWQSKLFAEFLSQNRPSENEVGRTIEGDHYPRTVNAAN